jgi:uncharacterized protein YlzI (FlbEa/FlbD family)
MNKHIILIPFDGGTYALFIEDIEYIVKGSIRLSNGRNYHHSESVESLVARINLILNHHG